jgi:hypothetical protein
MHKTINMENKLQIKVSEIRDLKERLNQINSIDISSIDFIDDDGKSIDIDSGKISDFKYMGLNNTDFIIYEFYKND